MNQILDELQWLLTHARPRRQRSMREFAEQEIVIPAGPFAGRRFRCARQPYIGLWFDAVDSGHWSRCVATGPTQSGKTLSCFVIPMLYHLFEVGETVVCGLPDMDMAADKWREDILPAIERSKYRDLLPQRGGGSRGGRVETLQFRNGATLKFMSGGGSDKSRAGFTSRVIVITETDGMDRSGGTSRESDKITQLEARTRAFGRRKRIYMECTVSTERGRTWHEYQSSTRSRIVLPCPHCRQWVSPEREQLLGWQEAPSQSAARDGGHFICPQCNARWTDADRAAANHSARLLHAGQTVDADGTIQGDMPEGDTLGLRWSGVHNLFLAAGDLAADEWRAVRAADEENAEREMRQFVWCIPVASSKQDEISLEVADIVARGEGLPQGVVPADASWLTAGIDLGKFLLHWIVVAWKEDATGQILDYGRIETACDDLGVEPSVLMALRQFREWAKNGWPVGRSDAPTTKTLNQCWVDAGYLPEVVHAFTRESGYPFVPAVGRGATQPRRPGLARPAPGASEVRQIGEGFHICFLPAENLLRVEVDADHWKTWVQQRLRTPVGQPAAMTLYHPASPSEHLSLARHLTAEHRVESYVAGRGVVVQWERLRRQNHWLDALYNASAAAYYCGARVLGKTPAPPGSPSPIVWSAEGPFGDRPWIDIERFREMSERIMSRR